MWRTGRVFRGRTIIVRQRQSKLPYPRFGFVVSSGVAKKATVRNRIKRRLRAIARAIYLTTPVDVVVYATKPAATATYADLEHELRHILTRPTHAPIPDRRH